MNQIKTEEKTAEQLAYDKAVRYLQKIKSIDNMITKKQEQIDSLIALASSTALHSDSERVQSSGCKDKIGDYCSKIVDLCAEINRDIDKFVDTKTDVMHIIDKLENLSERHLLYCRYFQYMPFTKIAREMDVSERHIYRMHKTAVQHMAEIM